MNVRDAIMLRNGGGRMIAGGMATTHARIVLALMLAGF